MMIWTSTKVDRDDKMIARWIETGVFLRIYCYSYLYYCLLIFFFLIPSMVVFLWYKMSFFFDQVFLKIWAIVFFFGNVFHKCVNLHHIFPVTFTFNTSAQGLLFGSWPVIAIVFEDQSRKSVFFSNRNEAPLNANIHQHIPCSPPPQKDIDTLVNGYQAARESNISFKFGGWWVLI